VIEIGCVELLGRNPTDNHFHRYINPERDSEEGALKVHGLTREFLADKPLFKDIAAEFLDYVRGAELLIHNAEFDVEFLDAELKLAGLGRLRDHVAGVIDTLAMARELHPGKRNALDALCERYEVNNAHRTLHGALLDARLLAEVYLAMTRGQESLVIELDSPAAVAAALNFDTSGLIVLHATPEELALHDKVMGRIDKQAKGGSVWRKILSP
jgi:DNA polymerase-3 subunit epsilon